MTDPAEEVRPGRAGYWVGGALIGLGVVVAAVLFGFALANSIGEFRELGDDIDAMARFAVPGEDVVALDETGDYLVYVEGPVIPVGRVGAGAVTVESVEPDSTPLVLRSVAFDETYDLSGHAGRAALAFTVDEPGDYRVVVGTVPASVTTVAIGPRIDIFGPVGSVFVVIFVPVGVGGLFVLAGGILVVVTGVRRSGARRRARLAAAPPVSAGGAVTPTYGRGPGAGTSPYGPQSHGPPPGAGVVGGGLPPGLPPSAYPPPGWPAGGRPPPEAFPAGYGGPTPAGAPVGPGAATGPGAGKRWPPPPGGAAPAPAGPPATTDTGAGAGDAADPPTDG